MGLVIKLKVGERVLVGEAVIYCKRITGNIIQLLIEAPSHVAITREKVLTKHGLSVDNPLNKESNE
jgi:sRNA-binding carbon storage regulator CsrA